MLNHTQLRCFKLTFTELIKHNEELVPVRFIDSCDIEGGDQP